MNNLSIPLVGMHFRPPAKEIIGILPLGTTLHLQPEPDNQYDSNAVAVIVDMRDFPARLTPLLETVLAPKFDACEIRAKGPIHVGYLAASGKKTAKGGPGNQEALMFMSVHGDQVIAALGSAPEGYPVVYIGLKDNG